MINLLHIENVAVIEKADIEFSGGLNVMTGETGAGKSIIIDAISALLGERVSKELVRAGSENALVSAQLDISDKIINWFSENDFENPEDETLLLSRKISAEGKSSCRVNGIPVSVTQLKSLGELLVDIHGQNDGRKLLDEAGHLAYLDRYAKIDWEALEYKEYYKRYIEAVRRAAELKKSEKNKERRLEELKSTIKEISGAKVKKGEMEELLSRRNFLKNAGKLENYISRAYAAMYGTDDESGALSLIIEAGNAVEAASGVIESLGTLSDTILDLRYRTEDVTAQISNYKKGLDFSPEELESLEARIALLQRIERRYGSFDEMEAALRDAKNELEDTEYLTQRIETLEKQVQGFRLDIIKTAEKLTEIRKKTAKQLEAKIAEQLSRLSMPGVRFEVEFRPKDGDGFDETGGDNVRFLISANAGEPLGRISKIASGGELSRIMLAMKNVLSQADNIGTLIFDEIDAGVSGIAAQRVGEKLYDLARSKQVLCVTHLPQIAAMADSQFSIAKSQKSGRTFTAVSELDTEGRKKELARLIGGENVTAITLKSAGELLENADKYKRG